jgi:hypothetical protein
VSEKAKQSVPQQAIEFFGTVELIDELARRHDTLIVAGLPLTGNGDFYVKCSGKLLAVAGLSQVIRKQVGVYTREALRS